MALQPETNDDLGGRTFKTAVVGSGYMGGGIAQVLALNGYEVQLSDVNQETAERAKYRLDEEARRFESNGLLPSGSAATIEANLKSALSIERAVQDADYITEAVPEVLELKGEVLKRISEACHPSSIIGSNTSAIPISHLANFVSNAERFLGVHWMNPAPFVPGVEIIPGPNTASQTINALETLIRSLGKSPARVSDTPGFVANRLQFALYREALLIAQEEVATPEQVDAVVRNSFGFRLALFGPFAIGDMAGLDVYAGAFNTLEEAYGERFKAPEMLIESVRHGNIGIKSGQGILNIHPDKQDQLLAWRDSAYAALSQLRTSLGEAPGL